MQTFNALWPNQLDVQTNGSFWFQLDTSMDWMIFGGTQIFT